MVKRIVVGAHYGLRDWLAQRVTALLMAMYTVVAVVALLLGQPISYTVWVDLFSSAWVRIPTALFAVCLAWHMWVGVRDILMDYIQPVGVRLSLQIVVLVVIAGYLVWTVQILWG